MAPEEVDFEREGLLDGLEEEEREARLELLRHLVDAGASLEQIKQAARQDRLALLPVELVLGRDAKYSVEDLAARTGLAVDFLIRNFVAIGLPKPARDDRRFTEHNLEAARLIKQLLDSGVGEDRILKVDRLFARTFSQLADAALEIAVEDLVGEARTERDLGLRLGQIAQELTPALGPLLEASMQAHLRERVTSRMIRTAELAGGRMPAGEPVAVCFADLVGFTSITEHSSGEDVGELAERFGDVVGDAAVAPVRFVKQIGDGAMLVAPEPPPLVDAAFDVLEASIAADLPELRIGLASGEALSRAGDWYGRPVNLASRISDVAPPCEVVATEEVCVAAAQNGYDVEPLGDTSLKGFEDPVRLYRMKRR